jgi:hypothetical protein
MLMARRDQRMLLALAVLSMAFAVLQHVAGINPDVLLAVPGLVLLLPLLAGRYVGEDGIARLAASAAARVRRPRAVAASGAIRRAPRILPRGGRLIATALGLRGPPALLATR